MLALTDVARRRSADRTIALTYMTLTMKSPEDMFQVVYHAQGVELPLPGSCMVQQTGAALLGYDA